MWGGEEVIPKLIFARSPQDHEEEYRIRMLARSCHAPGHWLLRARIIIASWECRRTSAIPDSLSCHTQTVRKHITRFNKQGIEGLGDRPGAGRKPRLTEEERSQIMALARTPPPGKLVRQGDTLAAQGQEGELHWTLEALTAAAHHRGITGGRSQVRRILRAEGVRTWAQSTDPDFVPKRTAVVALYTQPPNGATVLCLDELGPVIPRTYPPTPGWSPQDRLIKVPMDYSRGPEKTWIYEALRVRDGQARTLTAPARNTAGYLDLLRDVEAANPQGDLYLITDNLSSHNSRPTRQWLADHPGSTRCSSPPGLAG